MDYSAYLNNLVSFEFIWNQFLNEYNMGIFNQSDWPQVINRMTAIGEENDFEMVTFKWAGEQGWDENEVSEFVNAILPNLPNVKELKFDPYCTDSNLDTASASCPNLERLVLENCHGVTDEGIDSFLERCAGLASLEIENCPNISDIERLRQEFRDVNVTYSDSDPLEYNERNDTNPCLFGADGWIVAADEGDGDLDESCEGDGDVHDSYNFEGDLG